MSSSFDPYEILDIPRDAEPVEIRRAYQKLARRWHPEVNPGDAEAARHYAEAARAYRILADPDTRRRFDRKRRARAGGAGGHRGWITYEKFLAVHAEWTAAEPRDAETERRGADLAVDLTLDLKEAVRGVTASFSVQREVVCAACGASGRAGGECDTCGGRGQVVELDRLRVRIPPGVDDGTRLKVSGKGNPAPAETSGGRRAEPPSSGDLFVTIRVRPHAYFVRQGLDIHGDLPVRIDEAILGAEIPVPTIDGPVRVRLPAGTPGGQRFRLPGKGVASPSGRRGDHYYTVRIVVPLRVDGETEALLRKLARDDPRQGLPDEPL
jgi:molecular chaperone DnaJ